MIEWTEQSDIFALGEICYELIMKKHPFVGILIILY